MAQDLTVNIKTTSDVPQAMDKAKQATTGFGKQVDDIGKKFSTSFKDIFLSFLGPMALLTGALAIIGKMIADNEKKRAEANQAAIDGTNELMSAEDKYWARKNERENQTAKTIEEAKTARENTTQEFLEKDPRGQAMLKELQFQSMSNPVGQVAFRKQKDIQDKVQAIIREDMKKNPEVGSAIVEKAKDFKGPEGFGNVIGVGPNPVMEAMAASLEEAKKHTNLLQTLVDRNPFMTADFTKGTQSK
jgi:hypothetical protein